MVSISSSDPAVFSPRTGGADPCADLTPTIAAPNGSCTIEVTYSPSAAQHDESLTIQSDSAVDPQQVALTGTGFRVCTSADHRVLPEPPQPIATMLIEEACVSLTAGPYAIGSTGDVTFIAGEQVLLLNGFAVEGTFVAVIDPLLQ